MAVTSENELAKEVLIIANDADDDIATFKMCYQKIPNMLSLTADDIALSTTRKGEPMWHQRIRNIKSHHESKKNFIDKGYLVHVEDVGYKITEAGKKLIA